MRDIGENSSSFRRKLSAGLSITAACGLGLSAVLAAVSRPNTPELIVEQTELAVRSESVVNVNGSEESKPVEISFALVNRGNAPLLIDPVVALSPCCSSVLAAPSRVEPRERAYVRVQVSPGRYGVRAQFTARTNDPSHSTMTLRVKAAPAVQPPFFVHDPTFEVHWADIWSVKAIREFSVQTVERPNTRWIREINSDGAIVKIVPVGEPAVKDKGEDFELKLYRFTLSLQELPNPGRHEAKLRITTLSGPQRVVPLVLDVVPAVTLAPSSLLLDRSDQASFVEVVQREPTDAIIEITGHVPEWLEVAPADQLNGGGQRFMLRLKQSPPSQLLIAVLEFKRQSDEFPLELRVCVPPQFSANDSKPNP